MKQKIAFCAALLAFGFPDSEAARAQPMLPFYQGVRAELPPHEIAMIVRSSGLDPLSRPVRQGGAYSLRALDMAGREVRVVVDARRGRILRVGPVPGSNYVDLPPSYARPPGRIPDQESEGPASPAVPLDADGPPVNPALNARSPAGDPIAPGRGLAPSNSAAQSGAPPLPRPRPKLAAAHSPASEVAAPEAPPANQGAKAKDSSSTVATSPAWQGIEQQE